MYQHAFRGRSAPAARNQFQGMYIVLYRDNQCEIRRKVNKVLCVIAYTSAREDGDPR